MAIRNEWVHPRGALARDGWDAVVTPGSPGWRHTGMHVATLAGNEVVLPGGETERIVVPLAGSFSVDHEGTTTALRGREAVFEGPTDVLYVGTGERLVIHGRGRVAVAEAAATARRPSQYIPRARVPVEVRGAGRDTRLIHNFGTPDTLDAASLIACEVITPGGNWSSHPAHKHDEHIPGHETRLEEIYYFESAPAPGLPAPAGADAFGTFATYSSPAGEIDTCALVRTGDIVLVPHGYHGPAVAAPEYDLYYLNVMAGPGPERAWLVSDDPAQAWIRDSWAFQEPDPRLVGQRPASGQLAAGEGASR